MADKHIGNLRAENPVPNGIINPTDLLEVFRPNNESNPAQGGVSLGGTLQQIANFTLGNIRVVENENGVSFRIPEARLQACWGTLTLAYYSGHILEEEWQFPQEFNSSNGLVVIPARADIPRNPNNVAAARTYTLYAQRSHRQRSLVQLVGPTGGDAFKADSTIEVSLLAIGFY